MVSRLLKFLNRDIVSMNQAAFVLAVFSVLSQLCGLLRDHLLASRIGPSLHLDVYYSAFRIPDFIYNSFGVLFSVTVLIPFITDIVKRDSEHKTTHGIKKFLDSIFSVYFLGMVILSLVVAIMMPLLTKLTAPGFSALQQHELITFSRIMLLSPFLFGLSSLLSSFAQVQKKFFTFAIAPLLYNIGILVGILFFLPLWGMIGVVWGVILGAGLYFLIQLPTLIHLHKLPVLTKRIDWQTVRAVVRLSLPRTLGSSLSNLTFVAISALASLLAIGSVSVFQFSYNIENTPLLVFGISYAVAAFPTMSAFFTEGNMSALRDVLYRATRNIFFFTMPIALLMIVLRAHVVRLILGAGRFSWNDTRLVAASVALFCISITAQSMVLLLVRAFFAVGDTKTPLRINVGAVVVTILSATALVWCYHHNLFFQSFINSLLRIDGVSGGSVILLALAFSLGQIGNALALWKRFHKRNPHIVTGDGTLRRNLGHITAASIIAAAIAYGVLGIIGGSIDQTRYSGIFIQAALATLAGLLAYAFILLSLGNEDISLFIQTLRTKFWKAKPAVVQQQQDL